MILRRILSLIDVIKNAEDLAKNVKYRIRCLDMNFTVCNAFIVTQLIVPLNVLKTQVTIKHLN